MKNKNIGLLGGGKEQVRLANRLAAETDWTVYAMFLETPDLSPGVRVVRDFRDALWLCRVLVLPHPACLEGETLNAPLWPGRPVEAGQFLGSIGKGVLLLTGETTPALRRAAAAKEVALTPLPPAKCGEDWPQAVLGYLAPQLR